MRIKIVPATALAFGLTFSAVACAVEDPNAAPGTNAEAGGEKAETAKLKLAAQKLSGRDPLGEYKYKIKLTNLTGEGLDVDFFSFKGEDADGNTYQATPSVGLDPVRLADGKSVKGNITFSSPKIVKISYEETFGADSVTAKVKR